MINFLNIDNDYLKSTSSDDSRDLSDKEIIEQIFALKMKLKEKIVILGHHYQQDDVIQFADIKGDSLKLAQEASKIDKEYIIFCGVHFMAETADILTSNSQKVILPDLQAGCSMADMVTKDQIEKAWKFITDNTDEKVIPITYVNSSAEVKSFVGSHGGCICTSSNAHEVINWAFGQGQKIFFFPDQHLGRNTCFDLNIPLEKMSLYDPNKISGGLSSIEVKSAKVLLWFGFCSVHQGFNVNQIKVLKEKDPDIHIIVHPECSFEVVQAADESGSTAKIVEVIRSAPKGSKFAVGTEINLVNRLSQEFTDKKIMSLSPYQCLCSTMYRIRPAWLLRCLKSIEANKPINVISVSEEVKINSIKAINQMLEIS